MNKSGAGAARTLKPSLWRTCRALANRQRLRMLMKLVQRPNLTVSEVARDVRAPVAVASQYLRILNARGLLRAARKGRYVSYSVEADPTVNDAGVLLDALVLTFRTQPKPIDECFSCVTGFTHVRRIEMMRILDQAPLSSLALGQRMGAPERSVRRHLDKLIARGYVARQDVLFARVVPRSPLAAALLRIALTPDG